MCWGILRGDSWESLCSLSFTLQTSRMCGQPSWNVSAFKAIRETNPNCFQRESKGCAVAFHIAFLLAVADSLGSRPGHDRHYADLVKASVYMHHSSKRRTVLNLLLLRASCTPARRGSTKGQSISCQHFQITEVQERDTIMASIQMPLEVEKQQNEKAEDVEFEKTTNHLVIFDEPKRLPPTSLPTSVIVTSRPGPKPVTQSLFRKERVDSEEKPISSKHPKPPKAATASIFGADKVEQKTTPTVTTSKFFVPGQMELPSKKSSEQQIPLGSRDASKEDSSLEEERKFFEMLFDFDTSNLEQLAPHNGVDCVDLSKQASKTQQSTTGANMKTEEYSNLLGSVIDLSEIENFCGSMSTGCSEGTGYTESWSPGRRFNLTETPLLRPEEDIMWGMNVTEKDGGKGGGATCGQKRNLFCSEVGGEPPEKVRVVQNAGDYLLLISQWLGWVQDTESGDFDLGESLL